MKKLCFMLVCLTVILTAATCFGTGCYNRDLGIGISGGYAMLTGADDDPSKGFEERAEGWLMGHALLKKHFTRHWAIAGKLAYGFNYDKDSKAYRTNLVPIDLNFICDFRPEDTFNPYVTMGGGIVDWTVNHRPNEPNLESQRDPAVALGGGFDVFLNEIIALDINVTWRYMLTDDKDMIGRSYRNDGLVSNNDQLWYFGVGLTWYPKEPPDSDGDGVCDAKDRCPDTPSCCIVDEYGCEMDSDGDGVCDGCDECPDTRKGVKVDEVGCPKCDLSELEGITFRFDKSDVIPDPNPTLDRVLEILRDCYGVKVEIQGHTCSIGTEEYNMKLGMRRAESVKAYLIAHDGIDADNLFPKSFGESKPMATNDTKEGREQNRRVEFHVVD